MNTLRHSAKMVDQQLNSKSQPSLSWKPFYYTMSWILTPPKLNYFADSFNARLWEKIVMYGSFTVEMLVAVIGMTQVILPNNKFDAEDRASNFIIFFTTGSVLLKALTLIYYNAQLKELNEIIQTETSRLNLEPWEHKMAKKYFRYSKFIYINLMVLYFNCTLTFNLFPLFSSKDYSMPILLEFPGTSNSGSFGYVFNYCIGGWCVMYAGFVEVGFDIPAFLQGSFVGFELERCAHYCQMIGDFDTQYNTPEKQSTLLTNCIKLHTNIFDFIDEMATINTAIVAITIATGVPLMTVSLYSLLVGDVFKTICMMLASAFHLFMYCLLGEIVAVKCKEASTAIYTSQWYNIENIRDKRTFLFFLAVSQKEKSFSAGGLYNLSLETFTEFMKLTYAAAAFMTEVI